MRTVTRSVHGNLAYFVYPDGYTPGICSQLADMEAHNLRIDLPYVREAGRDTGLLRSFGLKPSEVPAVPSAEERMPGRYSPDDFSRVRSLLHL